MDEFGNQDKGRFSRFLSEAGIMGKDSEILKELKEQTRVLKGIQAALSQSGMKPAAGAAQNTGEGKLVPVSEELPDDGMPCTEDSQEDKSEDEIKELKKQIQTLKDSCNVLKAENSTLLELGRSDKKKAGKYDSLYQSYTALQGKYRELNDTTLPQIRGQLDEQERELEAVKENLEKANKDLGKKEQLLTSLQKEIEKKNNQLARRFGKGWELFELYNSNQLSDETRDQMQAVILHPDNFEAFICSCADDENFEKFWDIMSECIISGRRNDIKVLFPIFSYALDLCNETQSEKIYEVLLVEEGESFDSYSQRAIGEWNQGYIKDVLLPGYKNIFTDEIKRKSLVKLER